MGSRRMASEESKAPVAQKQEHDEEYSLVRQPSLYSLTLDEVQNAVCEPGKSFGSMNMDEFLNNIWSAEENQAAAEGVRHPDPPPPPLNRQSPIALPSPLSRKTVDQVWAEINHDHPPPPPQQQHRQRRQQPVPQVSHQNAEIDHGQPTFGEMTLEDFLIKAGVVRERYSSCMPVTHQPPAPAPHPGLPQRPQQYGMPGFQVGPAGGPAFGHVMYGDHHANGVYGMVVGDGGPGYAAVNGKSYGYGVVGSPASPASPEGAGQVDNSAAYQELGGRFSGRKRALEGPVEKVVERRQRRMIKNRESAARSRARKQAYTVELEAELNQLKEENARLKEEERKIQATRRQMILEFMDQRARENVGKTAGNLRRSSSCIW